MMIQVLHRFTVLTFAVLVIAAASEVIGQQDEFPVSIIHINDFHARYSCYRTEINFQLTKLTKTCFCFRKDSMIPTPTRIPIRKMKNVVAVTLD